MILDDDELEPVRRRMVSLEQDIYSWSSLLPNMQSSAPVAELQRVTMICNSAQAELSCLRKLLTIYEEYKRIAKKEISQHLLFFVCVVYGLMMLSVIIYLIGIAGV